MIEKLEKHCDEIKKGNDWVFICEYNINEIGNKVNEIIEAMNTHE
jgi:hypothetical protein